MKIGVSSYCFWPLLEGGSLSLFDAIEFAKKTGFDTMDFTDLKPPKGKSEAEYAAEIRKACEKAGLEICCYSVGANFLTGSGGDMHKEAERIKGCIDTAKLLGASLLRHDICWRLDPASKCRSWQDLIAKVELAIREIAEYAEGKGIRTMSENHGFVLQHSSSMEVLVRAVNHHNFGLLLDMGNFLCFDEPSVQAVAKLMPYAFHIHAKDFLYKSGAEPKPDDSWFCTKERNYLRGTVLGHGVVSVAQCLDIIKASGYDGCVCLEFEGLEEPLDAIRRGYEFMKARLKQ